MRTIDSEQKLLKQQILIPCDDNDYKILISSSSSITRTSLAFEPFFGPTIPATSS